MGDGEDWHLDPRCEEAYDGRLDPDRRTGYAHEGGRP